MSAFKTLVIPPQILPQIENAPLLKGESPQDYYDLFNGVAADVKPADMLEWLWVVQFVECVWEILRNRRYRAMLLELQRDQALRGVIQKASNYPEIRYVPDHEFKRWKEDPNEFRKHDVDPNSVAAVALLQSTGNLEMIDKIQGRLERRSDSILQQLEYRREIFAHRARHAAEKLLDAESVQPPRLTSPSMVAAIEPVQQTASTQYPPDDAANKEKNSSKSSVPKSKPKSPKVTSVDGKL